MAYTSVDLCADRLFLDWRTGLLNLKPQYEEAVFPALVAFCGIHNILWPHWLKSCAVAGKSLTAAERTLRIHDPELHSYPWGCVYNPLDSQSAWMLVRGASLQDKGKVLPELIHDDISLTLQTMTEKYRPIMYGKTQELFQRWGILSQWHAQGELQEVFLPVVRCERLLNDWSLWYDCTMPLMKPLEEFAQGRVASGREGKALRYDFMEIAGALWSRLHQEGLVQYVPLGASESLLHFFGLKKKTRRFQGILVLLGDHNALWEAMLQAPNYEEKK